MNFHLLQQAKLLSSTIQKTSSTGIDPGRHSVGKDCARRIGVIFCKAGAVGDGRLWGCVEHALHVFYIEFGEVKGEQGYLWAQE